MTRIETLQYYHDVMYPHLNKLDCINIELWLISIEYESETYFIKYNYGEGQYCCVRLNSVIDKTINWGNHGIYLENPDNTYIINTLFDMLSLDETKELFKYKVNEELDERKQKWIEETYKQLKEYWYEIL